MMNQISSQSLTPIKCQKIEQDPIFKLEGGAILLEVIMVALLLFFMVIAGNRLLSHYMQSYQQLFSLQQGLSEAQNRSQ